MHMHERATTKCSIPNSSPLNKTIDDFTGMDEMMMGEVPGNNCFAVCADKPPRGTKRRQGEINKEIPEDVAIAWEQADMKEPEPPTVQELIQEKVPEEFTDTLKRGTSAWSRMWTPRGTTIPRAGTILDRWTGSALPAAAANLALIVWMPPPRTARRTIMTLTDEMKEVIMTTGGEMASAAEVIQPIFPEVAHVHAKKTPIRGCWTVLQEGAYASQKAATERQWAA